MKYHLSILILFSTLPTGAQVRNAFSLTLHIQPEITRHAEDFAYRWGEKGFTTTFNAGIQAGLQYRVAGRIFAEAGLGYTPRRLNNTIYFFNQNVIPPPRQSPTQELVSFNKVTYRTLELPVSLGIVFLKLKQLDVYATGGYTGHYLLSANYGKGSASKYAGVYRKNHWQGHSLLAGIGADLKLKKRVYFSSRLNYTLRNTVKSDPYLFSQDIDGIPLNHLFIQGSVGVRWVL